MWFPGICIQFAIDRINFLLGLNDNFHLVYLDVWRDNALLWPYKHSCSGEWARARGPSCQTKCQKSPKNKFAVGYVWSKCKYILVLFRFGSSSCKKSFQRGTSENSMYYLHRWNWCYWEKKEWGVSQNIGNYHECEGGIEKSAMRLAKWWQTVIARDRFFYPIPTQIIDYFSCSPLKPSFLYFKKAFRSSGIRWVET